jgi:TonB family protein
MTARMDILDEPERLRGPFWTSLAMHAGLFGLFAAATVVQPFGKVVNLGDPNGGRSGSVAVTAVPSIPLPNRGSVPNPVANDTESQVPQAPSKPKAQPKVKTPEPNAIPLKSKNAKQTVSKQASAPNKWADQQKYKPNQVFSTGGQAVSSPVYNQPGAGGVGFGNNSPFGTQFGWYANLLREKISSAWRPGEVGARSQGSPVIVQFTMRRDGSLTPGLPRIVQSSGDGNLDRSAQRAILDGAPFPPLPPQLNGNEVNVELTFQLRR